MESYYQINYKVTFKPIIESYRDDPYVINIERGQIGWKEEEEIMNTFNQNDLVIESPRGIENKELTINFSKEEAKQLKCFKHASEITVKVPDLFLNPFVKREWELEPDTEYGCRWINTKEEVEKIEEEHKLIPRGITEKYEKEDGTFLLWGNFKTGLTKAVFNYTIQEDLIMRWWIITGCKKQYNKIDLAFVLCFLAVPDKTEEDHPTKKTKKPFKLFGVI